MAIETLDPNTALVVIDLQKGIVSQPTAHPTVDIVERSARLARAFRAAGLTVVLVNVAGAPPGRKDAPNRPAPPADWAELVPGLGMQPTDLLVTKQQWGAFQGTSLDHLLRRRGVTQIVLVGVATSIGVESTARAAQDIGYNVALVTDAMTDLDAQNHRHAIERIFPRIGQLCTTDEVLALLWAR